LNYHKINLLNKYSRTIVMLNMVITRENYQDVSNVIKFAKSIGIEYINFNRINLASILEINHRDYHQFFHSHEYGETISTLKKWQESSPGITFSDVPNDNKGGFKDCTFMWKHQYITWNGYIVPCCAKPFPKECNFGNVFDNGVMAVLNGKKMQAWRKLWQQNTTPAFCRDCNTIYL
ncbi:MAG: SPASM domain-containing protein, partial [Paludibacteraceae bacterium]